MVVVGAGIGGIGLAIGLRRDGHDVVVVDGRDGVGGTWRANTYPGAACDVPSHLYSLSFAPTADWSRVYAPQREILAYVEGVVDAHGLRPHLRLGETVLEAHYDEDRCGWEVVLDTGEVLVCDLLVAATGQLRRPLVPDVPGLADFPGPVVHSAEWRGDLAVDRARVAVVGSGASAIQLLPPLAARAGHLTLFQRTPPWVLAHWDRPFTRLERLALRRVPGARRLYRFLVWAWKELSWPVFRAGSWGNAVLRRVLERRLRREVPDPVLRARLRPDHPPGCKRLLVSDDWYPALRRPDVTVVDDGVARVEGSTLVAGDGRRAEADVVVLATGFRATELVAPLRVVGRDGRVLADDWADGARAHLGIEVHGYPNLFLLYGPNTNLAHNSILHMLESQMAFVRDAVARLARGEADAWEVRRDVEDRFVAEVDRRIERMVWSSGCGSWYVGDRDRNTLNWPGTTIEYRLRTRRLRPRDHDRHRRRAA